MASNLNVEKPAEELVEQKNEAAKKFYLAKEYREALKEYNDLIELCPNEFRHYGNRAACYIMIHKYSDALKDSKKCLQLNPRFYKSYVRIARCHLILGSLGEAEHTIAVLKLLDPNNSAIPMVSNYLTHVKNYIKEGDVAYAIKDFRKVVYCMDRCCDVATYCPRFKLMKAECLVFLGRYQEAQEIANNILHIDKQNLDAIYVRAMCLYYLGNIEKAFAHFQQVLRLAPDHTKAMEIYKRAKNLKKKKEEGNTAYKNNQFRTAYELYTEALIIDPKNIVMNAKLHFNKATAAAKCGLLQETVAECTEALKLDENYLKALLRRASAYMTLSDFEKAVHDLEKVCRMCNTREHKRLLMEAQFALNRAKRKDYYKILGINKTASTDDIKKAYRKRVMVHHPDRHVNATEGERKEQEKMFKEVGEAYGILSDPKKRSRYDNEHDINEYNRYDKDNDTMVFRYQDAPFW
ncbi:tetratricopeptide repeat protein 2 [Halictus rubicundus]|uniref:tetratricopeptide repeat protein 2 n=1 Tax=Halictus rubicundus TaxID=77578 RepID=UPI004036B261